MVALLPALLVTPAEGQGVDVDYARDPARLRKHRGMPFNEFWGNLWKPVHGPGSEALAVEKYLEAFGRGVGSHAHSHAAALDFYGRAESHEDMCRHGGWGQRKFHLTTRGNFFVSSLQKLRHDADQLAFLIEKEKLPRAFSDLAFRYRTLAEDLAAGSHGADPGGIFLITEHQLAFLRGTHNGLLHLPPPDAFPAALPPGARVLSDSFFPSPSPLSSSASSYNGGEGDAGGAAARLEREYLSSELSGGAPILFADEFLGEAALEALYVVSHRGRLSVG